MYFNFLSFLTQEDTVMVLDGFSVILHLLHMFITFYGPYSFDCICFIVAHLSFASSVHFSFAFSKGLQVQSFSVVWRSSSLRTLKIIFYLMSLLVDVEKSAFAFLKVIISFPSGCLSGLFIVMLLSVKMHLGQAWIYFYLFSFSFGAFFTLNWPLSLVIENSQLSSLHKLLLFLLLSSRIWLDIY